jgi:hypothetical protein
LRRFFAIRYSARAAAANQRAHCLAFRNYPFYNAVSVLYHDAIRDAERSQILRQHVLGITGMALVEVNRDDFEVNRRVRAQIKQDIE